MESMILDTRAASEFLNVSTATLRAWKRQRRGPNYFRCGRLVRYRKCDLDAWIAHHTVKNSEHKD